MKLRISLKEFQEALNQRIAQARAGALDAARLAVQAGQHNWLIRLPDVGEVVAVPALMPVPRTRAWFRGVGSARGTLYGVVDLAAFLGAPPVEPGPRARLLLVSRRHGQSAALLVERVLGLRKIGEFAPDPAPRAEAPWVGPAYRDDAGERWTQLEVGALLAADQFLQIAA